MLCLTLQVKMDGVENVDVCGNPCVKPFEDTVDVAWILPKGQLRDTKVSSRYHFLNTIQDARYVRHDGLWPTRHKTRGYAGYIAEPREPPMVIWSCHDSPTPFAFFVHAAVLSPLHYLWRDIRAAHKYLTLGRAEWCHGTSTASGIAAGVCTNFTGEKLVPSMDDAVMLL